MRRDANTEARIFKIQSGECVCAGGGEGTSHPGKANSQTPDYPECFWSDGALVIF